MISEKKLVEWLKGKKYITVNENSTEMAEEFEKEHQWELSRNCFINKVINFIEEQPKVNEWIPVSERLPEDYETVNITYVNRNPVSYYEHVKDKPFTGTAIFHYGKWYWYSCVCEDYLKDCGDSTCDRMDEDIEVLAWQPLPEPYDIRKKVD